MWAQGDDARMLGALTDPSIVRHELLPAEWDALSILRRVARAEPPLHALIDAGALLDGISNEDAARYLLRHGLDGIAACVFLGGGGEKLVLLREGGARAPTPRRRRSAPWRRRRRSPSPASRFYATFAPFGEPLAPLPEHFRRFGRAGTF